VLISEFIKNYKVNQVVNPDIEQLIDKCLSELKTFYGYEGDNYEPSNWGLDVLTDEENRLKQDPDELIRYVEDVSIQMGNEVEFNISSGTKDRVYKYKNRTVLTDVDDKLIDIDFIKIPLLLAMRELIKVYQQEHPIVSSIVKITRLITCSEQLRLLIKLSNLWGDLSQRNYDQNTVNEANVKHDLKPMNKLKKEIVFGLVNDELKKNKSTSITDLVKLIKKPFEKKINEINLEGKISESDQDEFLNNVKPIAFKRWVTESTKQP
jgi:hypothetical protein